MSFGIASLISWRGVWYVVHLGAISRTSVTGVVDDPTIGPGTFGPPGGLLTASAGHTRPTGSLRS